MRLSGNFNGIKPFYNQVLNAKHSNVSFNQDTFSSSVKNTTLSFQGFRFSSLFQSTKSKEKQLLRAELAMIYKEAKSLTINNSLSLQFKPTPEQIKDFEQRSFQAIDKVTPRNFNMLKEVLSEILIPVKIKTHAVEAIEAQIIRGKHIWDNIEILKSVFKGKIDLSNNKDIGYINNELLEEQAPFYRKISRVMRDGSTKDHDLKENLVSFFKDLIREVKSTEETYPFDNKPMRRTASNFLLKTIGRDKTARFFITEFYINTNTNKSEWLAKQVFRPQF